MLKCTMRACLFLGVLLEQFCDLSASQDFQYIQKLEGDSVDITCMAQQRNVRPSFLYLRRFAPSEMVLNISEARDLKLHPQTDGRMMISGDLDTVTVTLSHLKYTDTGLYVCEFLLENQQEQSLANTNIFLLVKADELWPCDRHSLIIYIMSLGVFLLLLLIIAFSAAHCKKLNSQKQLHPLIPIYEDMSGKCKRANLHQVHPQIAETAASVWANRLRNHYTSFKRTNQEEQHQQKEKI